MVHTQFREEEFTLRKLDDHLEKCDAIENSDNGNELSVEYGINRRSILIQLSHFDMCSGALLPDVMHDLLEGILQYEAKLVLQHCILEKKYTKLSSLNDLIENIELGYMGFDDHPTLITRSVLTGSEKNLGQKGTN